MGSALDPPPFFEHFLVVGVPPSFAESQAKVLIEDMQRLESENQVRVLISIYVLHPTVILNSYFMNNRRNRSQGFFRVNFPD